MTYSHENEPESVHKMALNRLGEAIRQLMARRNMSQVDLSLQIGISETALSLIVNGVNKPRQKNFTRILNRLGTTPEERSFLMDAYLEIDSGETGVGTDPRGPRYLPHQPPDEPGGAKYPTPGSNSAPPMEVEEDDELDTRPIPDDIPSHYVERKAASIAFEQDVEHLLHAARIPYVHPFASEKIACDFVTKTKTKIVIECKSNLNKDWDRLLGQCILLRDNLPADEVVIVVPYHNKISALYASDFKNQGFHVETPSTLIASLKRLGV